MKELFTLYYHRRILFTDFFSQSQESHYVLPGIFFLYLVYNSVILVFNAKETAFVFLLFSLVPGGIFFYFLMDKTIVNES